MNSTPAYDEKAPKDSPSRVLVVEDDPGVLDVINYLLSEFGLSGELFSNADAALRHLAAAPQVAAVLLDLDVQPISTEMLRRFAKYAPVVVLAGAGPGANAPQEALALVVKPFGVKTLSLALEKALGWASTRK